ncbi:MAG: DUF1294 domain-containing protein [Ruminococcus sp.]|nr:DUF1294 domain-containing protein [Candidatus Apopatosoma intestinale]
MTYSDFMLVGTLALIVVMSAVAFITFAVDKKRAIRGAERVKEKTLLTMAACFGAPGALIGRIVAHHKTGKLYFSIVIWTSLVLQGLLVVYLAFLAVR